MILHSFCQTDTPTLTKEDYLKKSKHQKTAAFLLLPVGVLSTGLGMLRFKNEDGSYGNSRNTVFLITGLAAIGGSITLFSASSKNKRNAMSVAMIIEKMPAFHYASSRLYQSYPAIELYLQLGKSK